MADVSEATAQIELLDQNLKKTHQLSSRMTGILAHFDTRLNRLERTILPLHQSTQATTRLQANIDATIAALSTVRVQQAASQSSSNRLLSPPTSLTADLPGYLKALDAVVEHIADLRASGLSGGEGALRDSNRVAETAFKALCKLLSSTLLVGSPSTPPELADYAHEAPDPEATLSTLSALVDSGLATYLARSPLAMQSGKRDWDEVWRIWGALRGEWIRSGVGLPAGAAAGDESAEGRLVEGWLEGAKNERLILLSLFPSTQPPPPALLTTLLAPSLVALKAHVLAHLQTLRKDPLPWRSYALFAHLSALQERWDEFFALPGATGGDWLAVDGSQQGEVGRALRGVCTRAIPEAVESAKVSAMIRPGEAPSVSVSSTTTETVAYLLTLPSHGHVVEQFLYALGDRKWLMGAASPASAAKDDGGSLLEHFVYDLIAALVNSMEARAKAMRSGTGGIYLVNNMTFLRDNIILNAPAEVGELLSEEAEDLLNRAFRNAKAAYLQPFHDLSRQLDSVTSATARQSAKDALTRFWDGLDALEATHRTFRLGGGEVRERMRDEVKKTVGGSYEACVGRLRGSLGIKYVRITSNELVTRLDGLYR